MRWGRFAGWPDLGEVDAKVPGFRFGGGELLENDAVEFDPAPAGSAYADRLRCEDPAGWHFGHRRVWNPRLLTSSLRTAHTDITRRRFRDTPQGHVEPVSRFFKLAKDGLCNTLRAGTDSARGAFTSPRPIHYEFPRCVSVREMARLHGYPDWFRFHRTKWHGAREIGNSVPPPLARAVGLSAMRALGHDPAPSNTAIPLGEERLLGMDMTQASAHWGVDRPIQRRDRKSGARKRKQEDIERERLAGTGS